MLKVYFSRRFSGFIAMACLLLVVAGGTGLAKAGSTLPMLVQVLGWLIIAAMAWGVIAGFRLLRQPALMYAVTSQGVRNYYDADRILFAEPGVFLPWELVAGMTLEKRNVSPGGTGNRRRTWVIACALNGDAPFAVGKHSVAYGKNDGERIVCLDAFTGTVSGQQFLDQLQPYWRAGQSRSAAR